jgi:hypothetical protein
MFNRRIGVFSACLTLLLTSAACDEGEAVEDNPQAREQTDSADFAPPPEKRIVLSRQCWCECGYWELQQPDTVWVSVDVRLEGVADEQACEAANGKRCHTGRDRGTLAACEIIWAPTEDGNGDGD